MVRPAAALLLALSVAVGQDTADLATIQRIKAEAFENSQVMDHLFYLADVYGPRLTNSPGHRSAAEWAMKRMKEYGLVNVRLEKWGPFGQSWRYTRYAGHMQEPQYQPLIGFPMAWTPGTQGPVTAEAVLAVLKTEADLAKFKGKLSGKIVLTMDPKTVLPISAAPFHRLTDEELRSRANIEDPSRMGPGGGAAQTTPETRAAAARFRNQVNQFLHDEGVLVAVQYGYNGDGGTVFAAAQGSRDLKDPVPPPTVALTPEHYNRIARLIQHKIPVKLEFDIQAEFLKDTEESFNVIGEIPGTTKKDELVMLGGHLDSWHGGTGATDNATGCSVALEALRILTTLKMPMARTVRVALWSGEEQGLLGSKAYVQEHFARRASMQLGPEYNKLSAYFNDDTGTGRFRGISVGGNMAVQPIFEAWMKPFHDLGATAVIGSTAPRTRQPG